MLSLIEGHKFCLDNHGFAGALLIDLSKAFDAINHELCIAKLHVYRFSTEANEVVLSCLQERQDWLLVLCCVLFTSAIYFWFKRN